MFVSEHFLPPDLTFKSPFGSADKRFDDASAIGRSRSRRVVLFVQSRRQRDRVRDGSRLPTRPRALVWLLEGGCRVGKVGGWGRRRSRERGIDLQWVRMSAGIDSAAMQRGLGGGETGIREYRDAAPGRTDGREANASEGRHICSGRGPGIWRTKGMASSGDGKAPGTERVRREGRKERRRMQRTGANFPLALPWP